MQKWLVVLPPEGAARMVAEHFIPSFGLEIGPANLKQFDTRTYFKAFDKLLAERDDNMIVDIINQQILVQCIDFDATHVLVMALSPVTLFILNLMKKIKIVTVHWFYEDFRRATYWRDVLPGYQHFIGFQRGLLQETCDAQGVQFSFLPPGTAYKQTFSITPESNRTTDVAFVGIPSQYRITQLEALASQGFSLAIGGSGWDAYQGNVLKPFIKSSEWVAGFEANQIYKSAKIGLNLSYDDPEADRVNTHISPRVYDIMNNGCWLITENVELASEILPDFAYNSFQNTRELVSIVQAVTQEFSGKYKRLQSNFDLVTQNHTYKNRVRKLLDIVNQ